MRVTSESEKSMKYEIKKFLSSKMMWVCFLIIFLSLLPPIKHLIVVSGYEDVEVYEKYINTMISKSPSIEVLMSALEKEKDYAKENMGTTHTQEEYIPIPVYMLAQRLVVEFPASRTRIIRSAIYEIAEEERAGRPDSDIVKRNEFVIKKYNREIDLQVAYVGSTQYDYFHATEWDYIFLVFVVLITVRILTFDRTTGAYQTMIPVAKKPRKIFYRQLVIVFASSCLVVVLHTLGNIFCAWYSGGLHTYGIPVQYISEMKMCPHLITVGEYFLLIALFKMLLALVLIAVIALIVVVVKKTLPAMLLGVTVSIAPLLTLYWLKGYVGASEGSIWSWQYKLYQACRAYLPHGLMDAESYMDNLDAIKIFGTYTCRIYVVIGVSIVVSVGCLVLTGILYGKPERQVGGLSVLEEE